VSVCTGEDAGWEVDVPFAGTVTLHPPGGKALAMQGPVTRLSLSREHACVQRVQGAIDPLASQPSDGLVRPVAAPGASPAFARDARTIDVSVLSARMRLPLRCIRR
jgi:hypothetical protein